MQWDSLCAFWMILASEKKLSVWWKSVLDRWSGSGRASWSNFFCWLINWQDDFVPHWDATFQNKQQQQSSNMTEISKIVPSLCATMSSAYWHQDQGWQLRIAVQSVLSNGFDDGKLLSSSRPLLKFYQQKHHIEALKKCQKMSQEKMPF